MRKRISVNDLSYTGGIIDGEGSICIRKSKSQKTQRGYLLELDVKVSNTNEWLIRWLHFSYGGSVCKRMGKGNERDYWQWAVQTNQALKFLQLIAPYLKIKKPQAELAIIFGVKRRVGKKKTETEIAIEEAQRITMLSYNRRGK